MAFTLQMKISSLELGDEPTNENKVFKTWLQTYK